MKYISSCLSYVRTKYCACTRRLMMKSPCCNMTLRRTANVLIAWLILGAIGLVVVAVLVFDAFSTAFVVIYVILILYEVRLCCLSIKPFLSASTFC